jgi:hypothetical protein
MMWQGWETQSVSRRLVFEGFWVQAGGLGVVPRACSVVLEGPCLISKVVGPRRPASSRVTWFATCWGAGETQNT